MYNEIDIENLKSKLKDYSKDYKENFNKIEKYIKSEIDEISKLKASKKSIIPEISFNQINQRNTKFVESIKKRGCVIVRDVFENLTIERLNNDLEKYIEENNYYDDQKINLLLLHKPIENLFLQFFPSDLLVFLFQQLFQLLK